MYIHYKNGQPFTSLFMLHNTWGLNKNMFIKLAFFSLSLKVKVRCRFYYYYHIIKITLSQFSYYWFFVHFSKEKCKQVEEWVQYIKCTCISRFLLSVVQSVDQIFFFTFFFPQQVSDFFSLELELVLWCLLLFFSFFNNLNFLTSYLPCWITRAFWLCNI